MKEKRTESVSARIKPTAKRIMQESKYNYSDAIEYFAYNLANKKQSKKMEYKMINTKIRRYENEIAYLTSERQQLADELEIDVDSEDFYADDISNSIQTVLYKFNKDKKNGDKTTRDIDEYVIMKSTYIERHAERCNLTLEDMQQRIVDAYHKKYSQQKLVV